VTQPGRLTMRRQVTAVSAGTPRRNWMERFGSPRLQSAESQMTRPFDMTWTCSRCGLMSKEQVRDAVETASTWNAGYCPA